jgi:uncharacterized protein
MSLVETRPEGIHVIRWVRPDAIGIDMMERTRSFLLAPGAIMDWAPRSLAEIDQAAVEAVLALEPALVLLGTGERYRMAPPAVLGAFLTRGIGLEAMDNGAVGRTFNPLAAEGRRVVAAFLLPG